MREIKFRAWDIDNKKMVKIKSLNLMSATSDYSVVIEPMTFIASEHLELMQYTNQKNHEDKEIYEGDYVSKELDNGFEYGEFEGVVELIDGKWVVNNRINHYEELFTEIEQIEILGNIYENPELLETKKD